YLPYFSAPDPTVKRKSGFLEPGFSSNSRYGTAVSVPYFWALAPDYDFTFTPTMTTQQGPLLQGEWRQRLSNGAYFIRASGIEQWDKEEFVHLDGSPRPGFRDFRGSLESSGQFALSNKWNWGWDLIAPTDKSFFSDYNTGHFKNNDLVESTPSVGVSQAYLSGRGDRSYFDVRSMYFYGFSEADVQSEIPIIHPVLDYAYTFANPVYGGELSYKVNAINLSRETASFDPISQVAYQEKLCQSASADPALNKNIGNCVLRGFPGVYSRFSAQTDWRRSFVDPFGQVFTPFTTLRADVANVSVDNEPGVSNYLSTGNSSIVRAMPTVGMEYRYPFIGVQSWGTQTIEPIAQIIARPNETGID